MSHPLDILIIEGSAVPFTRSQALVLQVPFTFEGLAEAYRLVPEAMKILIVPDVAINRTMPTATAINGFKYPQAVHPMVLELGLFSTECADTVPTQVEKSLAAIREVEQPAFIRLAARAAFGHILERTFPVVNSGGMVWLLMPEDLLSWSAEDAEFLRSTIPGIRVVREEIWTSRLQGEYAGMVETAGSFLRFGLSNEYSQLLEEEGCGEAAKPLPHPDKLLTMLPPDIDVGIVPGAVDRVGHYRILAFRWGAGQFILAPAVCRETLLSHLLPAENPEDVDEPARDIPQRLIAMLPATPSEMAAWTRAIGWDREDKRRRAIRSLPELANTLDDIPRGSKPATDKVPVRRGTGELDVQPMTGEALRKLLKRLRQKKLLPAGLSTFLVAAEAKWKACFRNT